MKLNNLPIALTALRALLAPVLLMLAFSKPNPVAMGACLVIAFLSDIFDGIVARRLGVATPNLRRLDSVADTVFYVAALIVACHLHASAMADHYVALAVLGALEVSRYLLDLAKFGKEASYHMWSPKLWGITLFAGFFALLVLGASDFWVATAIYTGIVADIEGLIISILLKEWRSDVPSFIHAYKVKLRQNSNI
jgi:CDP-diacylglycerol--glycerol-3-phosphate 3-phosphatidyltransferase